MDSFLFPRILYLVGYKNSYYYYYKYNGCYRYNYNRYYTGTNMIDNKRLVLADLSIHVIGKPVDSSTLQGDGGNAQIRVSNNENVLSIFSSLL